MRPGKSSFSGDLIPVLFRCDQRRDMNRFRVMAGISRVLRRSSVTLLLLSACNEEPAIPAAGAPGTALPTAAAPATPRGAATTPMETPGTVPGIVTAQQAPKAQSATAKAAMSLTVAPPGTAAASTPRTAAAASTRAVAPNIAETSPTAAKPCACKPGDPMCSCGAPARTANPALARCCAALVAGGHKATAVKCELHAARGDELARVRASLASGLQDAPMPAACR
jgi:hypothetical protein